MQDTFFYPNQKLIIPQLSQSVGITSHEFIVEDILQGGMGTCSPNFKTKQRTKFWYGFEQND